MKRILLSIVIIIYSATSFSQPEKDGVLTVSALNTVLNKYSSVTANITLGTNTVTVNNVATDLGGLVAGDLIMIYQAQGASITTTNTSAYGAVTALNSAGLYEYKYVVSVATNTITVDCNFANAYALAGKIQVIKVPQYSTLTINLGASVVGTPWQEIVGRRFGGVVAIRATSLVLNGTINASAIGFRGGAIDNNTSGANATIYTDFVTTSSSISAEKGEGIAGYQTEYDLLSGRYGRGAPANGGGGGNAHNAGGGGGANGNNGNTWTGQGVMCSACTGFAAWVLDPAYIANGNALTTSSGGGRGGYTYSSNNLNALTISPGTATWGGDQRDNSGGFGGRPLTNAGETRVFLGGGGGAGDANNSATQRAGNGGGLVYIISTGITGSGSVLASGENGLNTISGNNDAPGGAGGGGTIILKSAAIASTITLTANGGIGGNQLITSNEAEGSGGGGGGGYIAIVAGTPTLTAIGGANGTTLSASLTEFPANGTTSGASGQPTNIVTTAFITYLTTTAGSNSPVCVGASINLTTPAITGAAYAWSGPNSFTSTAQNPVITNATSAMAGVYTVTVTPVGCANITASTSAVVINALPATPTIASNSPVCAGSPINLSTALVANTTYNWTGPNSFTSSLQNPTIPFATSATSGTYSLTITNTTTGCTSAPGTTVVGILALPPAPTISTTQTACGISTGSITVTFPSSGVTYSFDNGLTFQASATKSGLAPGSYQVVVKNGFGCVSLSTSTTINAVPNCIPVAVNNSITGNEDAPVTINIVNNDTDADGTIIASTVDLNPSSPGIQNTFTVAGQGTYSVNALGVVSFVPVLNFSGTATPVNYTVQDNLGSTSNIATLTITLTPSGPSFNCSDKGFLIQDTPSKLYEVNLITGVSTIVMNPVSGVDEFNGMAYNPKDGFLYAKKLGTSEIIRIAANFTIATITVPALPAAGLVVGDIDTAGVYYLTGGTSTILNRIDLNPSSATNGTLLSSVTLPAGGIGSLDIGISYINNKGYAVTSGAVPHIFREINLSTGAITDIGTVTGGGSELENTIWGAAYMDLAGNFYFGSNNSGNIYKIKQPHLLTPGAVTSKFFSFGPLSTNNDGARCGYAPVDIDFADAPNSYGILLNANGARHGVVAGLSIGATVDADDDGIASALANGDDTNGADDEDGLAASVAISPLATSFTLAVPITNTSFATAKLFGWIDFNLDGIFQTSEGTSIAAPNSSTVNLTWSGITPTIGTSYLRLRLSNDANLTTATPNGAMQNGEAEDYTVTIANSAPDAVADVVITPLLEDGANGTVNIITNDTDADGNPTAPTNGVGQFSVDLDPLTAGIQTTITNATGVWTYNASTGVVTFDPANNYNGTSTIAYELCDVGTPAICDQANITFTVTAVNDAPDAVADVVATPLVEDGANGTVNIITNDTDVDGNPTAPTNGLGQFSVDMNTGLAGIQTTITNASGVWTYTASTGVVSFDPANNFNGTATLPYELCDPGTPVICDQANITFTVTGVNDAPDAVADVVATPLTEDGANGTVNIITNDTDADGNPTAPTNGVGQFSVDLDPLTAGIQTTITNATGVWTYNASTGVVTFDPANNYNGTSTIAYELCDVGTPAICDQANITFTVSSVNDAPDAVADVVATPLVEDGANGTVNIITNDTDVDGNPTAPTNGLGQFSVDMNTGLAGIQTTITNASGVWTYTASTGVVTFDPANNFNGTATLPYELCDPGTPVICDQANITFTVSDVNDAPIIDNENVSTLEDTNLLGDLTDAGDSDVDGNLVVNITPLSGPSNGDININPDGTYNYVPFNDFNGSDTVVVAICDDGNPLPIICTTDTIFITINPVNDAPNIDNEFISVPQNQSASGDLSNSGDDDIEGTILVVTLLPITPPSHGSIIINADGTYTYSPNIGYVGADLVVVQICDQGIPLPAICVNDTIFINVLPTVPPVADNNSTSTLEEVSITFNVTDSDTDVDGTIDEATVDLDVSLAGIQNLIITSDGTWSVDNLGNVTFAPALNYNGDATLSYTVNDNDGATSNEAILTVTVSPINDAPTLDNENETAQEDTDVNGDLTNVGDNDVDGSLVVNTTPITGPLNGTIVINIDGTFTYTPDQNFNGSDIIVVEICDDGTPLPGICVNDTIFITIDSVNDNPLADDNSASTLEDTEITFNVISTDTDLDGIIDATTVDLDPFSAGNQNIINAAEGTWVVDNLGNVTFTPAPDFNGIASISYVVNDNEGGISNIADLMVDVTPVNDAPVLDNENLTASEEAIITGDLTDVEDSDIDGNLIVNSSPISGPTNGDIIINADGTFTYTPNADFVGTDIIVVEICDDGTPLPKVCVNDTIFITIDPVNDAPIIDNEFISVGQNLQFDGDLTDFGDIDPDGTGLLATIIPIVNPTNGTIVINEDGTYQYTPNLDYIGLDIVVVEICDQGLPLPAICVNDTIFINVLPTVPPVADNDAANTLEDTEITFNVTNTDTDVDGTIDESSVDLDPSTAGIQNTFSTAEGDWSVDNSGNVTFNPTTDFNGDATISYTVNDNLGATSNIAEITVSVQPVNDAPIIDNEIVFASEDTDITGDLTDVGDSDLDGILIVNTTPISGPVNGNIIINSDGTYTYTPDLNFNGSDTIVVEICDDGTPLPAICVNDTIFISIDPVNDSPFVDNENILVVQNQSSTGDLTNAGDADPDGTDLIANTTPIVDPTNGTITINADGTYQYTPNLDFIGNDTVVVEICDQGLPLPAICINDTIFIVVTDAIPPVANPDSSNTLEDTSVTFNILDNDTDIDETIDAGTVDLDIFTAGIQNSITNAEGSWSVDNLGNLTFVPALNFNGTATITYVVTDNDGLPSNTGEISVLVTPVNDPPLIDSDNVTTTEDTPFSGDLTNAGDSDVDGNLVVNTNPIFGPSNGTITVNADGTFTYSPNQNFNGTDTIVVEICDDGTPLPIICANDTIFITVSPVNDLQSQGNETIVVSENSTEENIDVLTNNIDPDGETLVVTSNASSTQGGTVIVNTDGTITYTPALNYLGADTIFYTVCDLQPIPNCVNDTIFILVQPDHDGDGVTDALDIDDDNDGIQDSIECSTALNNCDTDGDGVSDVFDLDSDNDGISDIEEAGGGQFDTNNDGVIDIPLDADNDGLFDVADGNSGGVDLPVNDTDSDGHPDFQDLDSDNDGINDITESGNNSLADLNSDGIVDGPDTDGDGINDSADADNGGTLSDPIDTDGDGNPDYQDLDSDNDAINDIIESGNAVLDANNDGLVDGPDTDNDGINDSADANDTTFGDPDTTDEPIDTDNDGNPDYTDLDSDNDGISDVVESGNGEFDTDGDGMVDGADTDGDGILDPVDGNTDQFGDTGNGSDPLDTDGDGKPNYVDLDSDNDGINDGVDNEVATQDCDGDGLSNYIDADACGISIPDGFSPNDDGVNDVFVIRGIENYPNNTFEIFNRWGNRVLDSKPYDNKWNGIATEGLRIGTEQLPVGTYFYVLDLGDGSEVLKGYIYLNR